MADEVKRPRRRRAISPDGRTAYVGQNAAPTKRTPERRALILEALSQGATYNDCANLVGIDSQTLVAWRREDPDFHRECEKARAKMKVLMLAIIQKAAIEWRQWQAAAWKLERIYPEEFGRKFQPIAMVNPDENRDSPGKIYRVVVEPGRQPRKEAVVGAADQGALGKAPPVPDLDASIDEVDPDTVPEGVLEVPELPDTGTISASRL